jgi:uncharacterized membrane protein
MGERTDRVLVATTVVVVVAALVTIGYGFTVSEDASPATELYLLSQNSNQTFATNVSTQAVVRVGLHNRRTNEEDYVLQVQSQRVRFQGNDSRVTNRSELYRQHLTVESRQEVRKNISYELAPNTSKNRIMILVFHNGVPEEPTRANAHRTVHFWINTSEK